jgi:hypothetical protein
MESTVKRRLRVLLMLSVFLILLNTFVTLYGFY